MRGEPGQDALVEASPEELRARVARASTQRNEHWRQARLHNEAAQEFYDEMAECLLELRRRGLDYSQTSG